MVARMQPGQPSKTCPNCGAEVREQATICRHCKTRLGRRPRNRLVKAKAGGAKAPLPPMSRPERWVLGAACVLAVGIFWVQNVTPDDDPPRERPGSQTSQYDSCVERRVLSVEDCATRYLVR